MNDTNATTNAAHDQALTELRARLGAELAATAGNARAQTAVLVRTHVAALRAIRAEILCQLDRTLSMYGELERWPESGAPPKIAITVDRALREQDVLDHPEPCSGCGVCEARRVLMEFGGALPVQALLDEALTVAAGNSNTPDGEIAIQHFFDCIDNVFIDKASDLKVYQAAIAALAGREARS